MPFERGESGNPGGRPKENARIKKAAQAHGDLAIERLAYWAQSEDARASIAACQALLDRGFGKPGQAIEHSGMIASTHEELLKQLDSADDADGEVDTAPA